MQMKKLVLVDLDILYLVGVLGWDLKVGVGGLYSTIHCMGASGTPMKSSKNKLQFQLASRNMLGGKFPSMIYSICTAGISSCLRVCTL